MKRATLNSKEAALLVGVTPKPHCAWIRTKNIPAEKIPALNAGA